MNAPGLRRHSDPFPHAEAGWRTAGRFELAFRRSGQRTHVAGQFVSYPFHMTRPFRLDPGIPSLLTIYQQSSSGGLYRGEDLRSRFALGAESAAHVTTQSATVVHDCQGSPARQAIEAVLDAGAFLALTPDPLVLFPGARCESKLVARLSPGAVLLLSDAFTSHDPEQRDRRFDEIASIVRVEDHAGRLLVREAFRVTGEALAGAASPTGRRRIVSTFMLVGERSRLPPRASLVEIGSPAAAVCGVTELPNGAGYAVRCVADDAISGRAVSEKLFSLSVEAAFGALPAPRRK
jgi:urease accessory protein